MTLPAEELGYTYADYLNWDDDERYELIDGEPYMMSPPLRIHQKVSGELFAQLHSYLDGKQCEVYHAPFGVRLFEEEGDRPEDVTTVVEPDLVVVCDPNKLDDRGCKGAPDLIIEILSPTTRRHDRVIKQALYQRAGVKEYWIVNPEDKTVQVLTQQEGYLLPHEDYGREDMAKVNVLEDCSIELRKVFSE